jgi:hypothetical protein
MTGILAAPGPLANLGSSRDACYPDTQYLKRNNLLGRFEAWIYPIDGRISVRWRVSYLIAHLTDTMDAGPLCWGEHDLIDGASHAPFERNDVARD